jgi:uncharacterized protein
MGNLLWKQIHPNIFFVYVDGIGVVYAPLLGKFFSVPKEAMGIVWDYLNSGKPETHELHQHLISEGFFEEVEMPRIAKEGPFNSREVTLSVTSACNLRCIYCYANAGINFCDLPWVLIEKSIQQLYVYANERNDTDVELSFHGTGETLVRWQVMVKAVNYALQLLPEGWTIHFSLVTNGTLIDDEKAQFLKKYGFSVVLSMDGIEEIQNILRPKADGTGSFDDVVKGMKALVKNDVFFAVRTTVTGLNQDTILDFLELCATNGCREISAAPFSATGRGQDGVDDVDPDIFVKNYLLAKKRARELGMIFKTPSDCLDNASVRYCNADGESFALMPEGIISCCTRVTRKNDPLVDLFVIGHITEEGVEINQSKVEKLKTLNLHNYQECQECFVKYTCSGGCHHTRFLNGNHQPASYCEIIRAVVWDTLKNAAFEA